MPQEKELSEISPLFNEEFKEPTLYKIILHNDDYTTMDFVISILIDVFHKSMEESKRLMLTVHNHGKAVIGLYTKEIAETKVDKTLKLAKNAGYPLLCTFEPED